jgi:hypothetical protein
MAELDQSSNRVFHGREATVIIGKELDSISSTESLAKQLTDTTTFSGILTEITLTDPEASVEVQNTFGGQVMSESPHELVEIEFTARFEDTKLMEELHGESTTAATDFQRVQGGTTIGSRPQSAILFRVEKGGSQEEDGDIINYLMNNAIFQQMGEISLAGDGAAEITGTAVCRVGDRIFEKNF